MYDNNVDHYAQLIYDYHFLKQPLKKADCIFVLGSHDPSVADYAVQLYQQGYAPYILFSGGVIRPAGELRNNVPKSEAAAFFDIAIQQRVPPEAIILENKATNTGENFIFTRELLMEKQVKFKSFILVQKPYMLRRTYATAMMQFYGFDFVISALPDSYNSYIDRCAENNISKERVITNMMGDLQRIKAYPAKGFSITMEIPGEIWDACEKLKEIGYTSR
jgi:hypothetical protein